MEDKNIISDWLKDNGNPEIERQVEEEARLLMSDKQIEDLLNPILEESMQSSLDMMIEIKNNNELSKDNREEIDFILLWIGDAFEYYTSTNNIRNLAILSDLKQYLLEII